MEGLRGVAAGVPARLTVAQGRRFGLTVGAAFLTFAAVAEWREHHVLATGLAAIGAWLTVAALTIPTYLGPLERAWMGMAHAISSVTTPIVMGVMYVTVVAPVGVARRLFGENPLVHKEGERGFWRARRVRRSTSMRRQF
jgi:hypothetical protein